MRLLPALLLLGSLTAAAQTYTPKAIRFEGVPAADAPALLQTAGLTEGQPVTKEQIEAALAKLADTGSFSDISYTVDAHALVIKLTADATHRPLPIRFANFVWWQPADLERQIEARVPLFHGEMPAEGSIAEQVKAALVAIAKEKGLTITVDATHDGRTSTIALAIQSPSIVVGKLDAPDIKPLAGASMDDLKKAIHGQEFDESLTTYTLHHDTLEIYQNAGYLEATVGDPVFTGPNQEGARYTMDAAITVQPHDQYHVADVDIHAASPLAGPELRKSSGLNPGAPVSPMLADLAPKLIARQYSDLGYLDAEARESSHTDKAAHTVSYAFDITPGDLYHLARISVEAGIDPAIGQALQHDKRLAAGVVAGNNVMAAAYEILRDHKVLNTVSFSLEPFHQDHTAALVVKLRTPHPVS